MTTETLEEAREHDRAGRTIDVLILVKTTPTPSEKYEDTVCVAGIALSPGPVRWVRLYPIAFRHLAHDKRFKKYAVVRVHVSSPRNDQRAESLHADAGTLTVVKDYGSGPQRNALMAGVPLTTTCRLLDGIRTDINGPSLGMVAARQVRLEIEPHKGWTKAQQAKIDRWQQQPAFDLGLDDHIDAPPLEAPPFQAWYRYKCEAPDCNGHRQGILDWELTALQRRAQHEHKDPRRWIEDKYGDQMLAAERRQLLALGNHSLPNRRRTFSVLSIYYPKNEDWARAVNARSQQDSTLF